ncbi:patatin-like phospholipase family protein [bacterium]|nr:patatin-like phospholipase family protein [bacterium]
MEKIGLVLGGGGAKGAFAAGALKAIYDKIYPKWFDIVSGTSIGAFNGVLASLGQVDKMEWFNTGRSSFKMAITYKTFN